MALVEFLKTPTAILDYGLAWAGNIVADTITGVTWTIPAGITKVSESLTTTQTNVRLSGGTIGQSYDCKVLITRSPSGQKDPRVIRITIVQYIVLKKYTLRPGAELDYQPDWLSSYAQGDTISSHSWSAGGLTIIGASNAAAVRLSGSNAGLFYATDHIVMTSGQEDDRSLMIRVRDV